MVLRPRRMGRRLLGRVAQYTLGGVAGHCLEVMGYYDCSASFR